MGRAPMGRALVGPVLVATTLALGACSRSPLDIDGLRLSAGQGATGAPGSPTPSPPDEDTRVEEATDPPPPPDDVPDPAPSPCLPGTGDFIYLMTDTLALHRFDPRAGRAEAIGQLDCATARESAFSMAVDQNGDAIVLLRNGGFGLPGELVRASTRNGACERVFDYEPGQLEFGLFGMAFTADAEGGGETLYVHGGELTGSGGGLGALDTETWRITPIGVEDAIGAAELAGTPDGRLLALFTRSEAWDAWSLGELDRDSGRLLWERPLPSLPVTAEVDAFAVAFWDDSLYAFLSRPLPSGQPETTVLRNGLAQGGFETEATLPLRIVGVGATTCEPNPLAAQD